MIWWQTGDVSGAKGKTDCLCRKPITAEEWRREWKMGS